MVVLVDLVANAIGADPCRTETCQVAVERLAHAMSVLEQGTKQVVDAIDIWMRPALDDATRSAAAVVEQLETESGTRFDPVIATIASGLLQG